MISNCPNTAFDYLASAGHRGVCARMSAVDATPLIPRMLISAPRCGTRMTCLSFCRSSAAVVELNSTRRRSRVGPPASRPWRRWHRGSVGCRRRTATTLSDSGLRRASVQGRTGPDRNTPRRSHAPGHTRNHHDTGRQPIADEIDWCGEEPAYVEHHRTDPQRLLCQRVEVFVAGRVARRTCVGCPHRLGQHSRVASEALSAQERPVAVVSCPADQQRHQFVPQLAVSHRAPVLVGGADQHRQHIGARSHVGVGATVGDLGVEQVDRLLRCADAALATGGGAAGPAWRAPTSPMDPRRAAAA